MLDIFYDKCNFIIEEVHKIIVGEDSGKAGFNRMMALSQLGYSAEKDPWLVLVFFYQH